jgi:hypothetical protein
MIIYQPAGTMEEFFLEGSQLLLKTRHLMSGKHFVAFTG